MRLEVRSDERVEILDVTPDVEAVVPDDLDAGVCVAFVPHTTAGIVVNEDEDRLRDDLIGWLEGFAPRGGGYRHDEIDDNADAHLRAVLLGESVSLPVRDGALALGTWQSVLFVECDGPRRRSLDVSVLPGG